MKRLTKKNHDLEEQLRRKNAGLNTLEEDQKGTRVKRRDQEGPEGSNAPSKPERQDISHPSAADLTLPHTIVKMQMMKERMDFMMNALRRRVSSDLDDLVHQTDSPFTTPITSFSLPPKFYMPQLETYNESKDPLDHLKSFKTLMHLQEVSYKII